MHREELNRETTRENEGLIRFQVYKRLTSDLPINGIRAVILVIICTGTARLPEHQKSSSETKHSIIHLKLMCRLKTNVKEANAGHFIASGFVNGQCLSHTLAETHRHIPAYPV